MTRAGGERVKAVIRRAVEGTPLASRDSRFLRFSAASRREAAMERPRGLEASAFL